MLCRAIGALASENDIAGFELPIRWGGFLEPRIATFQRRELVFQPKAHFACWSHARPDSFKDSLLFLQLVHAKESLISLRKA